MTEIDSVELIDTTENKPKIELEEASTVQGELKEPFHEASHETSRRDFDSSWSNLAVSAYR